MLKQRNIALIAHEKWTWQCREKQARTPPLSLVLWPHLLSPGIYEMFSLPPSLPFLSEAQGKVRAKNSILLALHEKSWWASCWLLYLSFRQDGSRYSWAIAVNKNNVLLWKLLPHQQAKCYWKKNILWFKIFSTKFIGCLVFLSSFFTLPVSHFLQYLLSVPPLV